MKRFICFLIGHVWVAPVWSYGNPFAVCQRCNKSMRLTDDDFEG